MIPETRMPPSNVRFDPNRIPAFTSVAITMSGDGLNEVTQLYTTMAGFPRYDPDWAFDQDGNIVLRSSPDYGVGQYQVVVYGSWGSGGFSYSAGSTYELDRLPPGRGRWRILVVRRSYAPPSIYRSDPDIVAEVMDARSRRLEFKLNAPSQFRFTVDGRSNSAALIRELEHEIWVSRWDEVIGRDTTFFRGVITQSQDTLSPQVHTINFVAFDYLAILGRRFLTLPYSPRNTDQDNIVTALVDRGNTAARPTTQVPPGFTFVPASHIPLTVRRKYPDGTARAAPSTRVRDRDYAAQSNIGELIDNLASVQDGYDYGVSQYNNDFRWPDGLDVYYPHRGITREDYALVFGLTVSGLSRSVNSSDYANYVRVAGQPDEAEGETPYAEGWVSDINDVISNPQGFWPFGISQADVTETNTLVEKAGGALLDMSVFKASYSLQMRPGAFRPGDFDIGDQVRLRINSGRLDVDTYVRVVGLTYDINDDAVSDDMEVDVTRGAPNLINLNQQQNNRISALERR